MTTPTPFGSFYDLVLTGLVLPESDPNTSAPIAARIVQAPAKDQWGEFSFEMIFSIQAPGAATCSVQVWIQDGTTGRWEALGGVVNIGKADTVVGGGMTLPTSANVFIQVIQDTGAPTKLAVGLRAGTGTEIAALDAATSFATGQAVTAGATTALSALAGGPTKSMRAGYLIKNLEPNGGHTVYVGGPTVTTGNGWPVGPGETSPNLGQDPTAIYLVPDAGTPTVAWMGSTHG